MQNVGPQDKKGNTMIGSLIGAGLGAAASIFGGIQARKAARKANRMLEQQQADNQAWYDRRYNEDATQRADAQRMLTMTMDRIRERNKAAAGTAAVMGSGAEAVAAEKAANAQVLADTASQIAAAGAARKDQVEGQYLATKNAVNQQQVANQMQTAQNVAAATQGAASALANAGASIDALRDADKDRELLKQLYG
jgi:hypothetical protein